MKINLSPEELNDFYFSIGEKLKEDIKDSCDPLEYLRNVNVVENFILTDTDVHELIQIINTIKNKNLAGIDQISVKIFKNLPESASLVLVECINESFRSGIFPTCLKIAMVIQLHKGGDLEDPSNVRPISLLSTL